MGDTATLDVESILANAAEIAGLDDYGDPSLPGRLCDLAEQMDGRLDDRGRALAADTMRALLIQRLEFFESSRRHPLGQERIERPIIAFGEGRSGTTVLQMLLGCDADARLPEFWEVMRPTPPLTGDDNRRALGDQDWAEILEQIPRWLVSHPYNAMLGRNPPECERFWAMDFRAAPPTAWWRVPMVPLASPRIVLEQDSSRQYEIHRMMLKQLQHQRPTRRWVLKGVTHQQRLPALLDAYPDAIFVWIHRDPLPTIASRFEMHAQIYEGIAGSIDRSDFASTTVDLCVSSFLNAAENPAADDPRIHHLLYEEFTKAPIATIRQLYDRAGLSFTPEFQRSMEEWLADNTPGRFGRFTYSAEALGVDLDALDAHVQPYRDRFHIPREHERK